jgi:hypothetical protein
LQALPTLLNVKKDNMKKGKKKLANN